MIGHLLSRFIRIQFTIAKLQEEYSVLSEEISLPSEPIKRPIKFEVKLSALLSAFIISSIISSIISFVYKFDEDSKTLRRLAVRMLLIRSLMERINWLRAAHRNPWRMRLCFTPKLVIVMPGTLRHAAV